MVVIWGEVGMGRGFMPQPPWLKSRSGVDLLYAPEFGLWGCTLMRLDGCTLNAQSARGFALEVQSARNPDIILWPLKADAYSGT